MSQIPVKMVTSTNAALHRLRQLMKTVHEEVERRAYDLSLQKDWKSGRELEDWVEAERQVLSCPPSELRESMDEIGIKAAVPGVDAKTLQVDVLPNSITIEVKVGKAEERNDENIHCPEFGERRLLRQFALPARIDPQEVTAMLGDGVLHIVARKASVTGSAILKKAETSKRATA